MSWDGSPIVFSGTIPGCRDVGPPDCNALTRGLQKTALDGKWQFRALPFEVSHRVDRFCTCVSASGRIFIPTGRLRRRSTILKFLEVVNEEQHFLAWGPQYRGPRCWPRLPAVLAQAPLPTQFSGVINDYTPSTSSPMGPWEMRGPWSLTLNGAASHGRFYGDLDDGTFRLHAKLFEYRFNVGLDLPNAAHPPHRDRGRHRHANSYRRVR